MTFRRTILKQDLARKLFPDSINSISAVQLLRKEIRETPSLKEKLYANGENSQLRYFTNRQMNLLLEHFCITPEEFKAA